MMKFFWISHLIIVFILSSCGKPTNKSSGNGLSGFSTQSGAFTSIKNQHRCASGSRLPDINLNSKYFRFLPCTRSRQGECMNLETANVYNTLQSGFINGSTNAVYIGKSSRNDLIFVGRVGNYPSIQGFNIVASLCPNTPLVSSERIPTQIQIQHNTSIILHQSNNCKYHKVTSATLRGNIPPLHPLPAYPNAFSATFSSLNCSN